MIFFKKNPRRAGCVAFKAAKMPSDSEGEDNASSSGGGGGGAGGLKRARQPDLHEAGGIEWRSVAERRANALVLLTGSLVAGGGGAASLPYTSINKTLDKDFLQLLPDLESGFPSPTSTREVVLPKMVEMVKEYQDRELKGKDISIHVDGGSGELACGIKVLPWIASSPLLPFEFVLDIDLLPVHETAKIQARLLTKLVNKRKIPRRRIIYLSVDNNELNIKTGQLLNEDGFSIEVARCIDHCLNLVFVAFLEPFEAKFAMGKLLRGIRGYIKSGGGQSRRATLCEHALSMSGIDFTQTRWTSFLKAVMYVMGIQSQRELKRAREQLQLMATWGDESAAEALDEPDVPRLRWDELYDALASMGQNEEGAKKSKAAARAAAAAAAGAGEVKEARLDTLLESLCDIEVFMAFYVVSNLFSSVPALFRVLQGDERFAPLLDGLSARDTKGMENGAFHVATAVTGVIEELKGLSEDDSPQRAAIILDAYEVCTKRIEAAIAKAEEDDEPLLPKKKKEDRHFDVADVVQYRAGAMQALDNAKARVEKAIKEGCKAFKECAGMDKLREAVDGLELKRRYSLNIQHCPDSPPFAAVGGGGAGGAAGGGGGGAIDAGTLVFEFFGVPVLERSLALASRLKQQWASHRQQYKPPPAGSIIPPAATMQYWMGLQPHAPDLSKYACFRLLRPNGNAAPERLMSLLTAMDKPSARTTKAQTLKQVLFLRGNAGIVRTLVAVGT